MPPAPYRCQVIIPANSLVNRDSIVNTFGIDAPDENLDWWAGWKTDLAALYGSWSNWRGIGYAWTQTQVKLYNLNDTKPRVPLKSESLGLVAGAPTTTCLPQEVALCLSFQGPKISGIPQSRRRGRVYFGPFDQNANSTSGRPASGVIAAIVAGANTFLGKHNGGIDEPAQWSVISERTGAPQTVYITEGWVDDAWDTQRRRGVRAATRSTFAI